MSEQLNYQNHEIFGLQLHVIYTEEIMIHIDTGKPLRTQSW